MLVIKQKMIYREDLKSNPDVLYIFGDNTDREGRGGQAAEMRGEPNAFGVVTKRHAHYNRDAFFHDTDNDFMSILKQDFERLWKVAPQYRAVIIPADGIGTGLARLPENAPSHLAYINQQLGLLEGL